MYTWIVGKVDAFAHLLFREFTAVPIEVEKWKFTTEIVVYKANSYTEMELEWNSVEA